MEVELKRKELEQNFVEEERVDVKVVVMVKVEESQEGSSDGQ